MNRLHQFLEHINYLRNNAHAFQDHPSMYMDLLVKHIDTNTMVYRTPLSLYIRYDSQARTQAYHLTHTKKNGKPVIHSELNQLFSKRPTPSAKYAFVTVIHQNNEQWCHMNTLILTYEDRTVRLFEPHGTPRNKMVDAVENFFRDILPDKRRSFNINKWKFANLKAPPNKNHNGLQIKGNGVEKKGLCVLWNFYVVQYVIREGVSKIHSLYYRNSKYLRNDMRKFLEPYWEKVKNQKFSNSYKRFTSIVKIYYEQNCHMNQPINLTTDVVNLS